MGLMAQECSLSDEGGKWGEGEDLGEGLGEGFFC